MKIKITNEWAMEMVVCTNLETLGIDANDPEVVTEAMQACEPVFDKYFNNCWSFVEEDSYFRNWNGGKHRKQGYCEGHFSFDFFKRDIGDDAFGEWKWIAVENVPIILRVGLEKILEKCNEAICNSLEAYQARTTE